MKVILSVFTLMALSLAATKSFALQCPTGYAHPDDLPQGTFVVAPTKPECNALKGAAELMWIDECRENPQNVVELGTWSTCMGIYLESPGFFIAHLPALCCERVD